MMARMDANQAKTDVHLKEMRSWIANIRDDRKETMSCQVTKKACLESKKPNPEGMEFEMEHREVPMEEAAV
jgi:hypothetical protein